MAANLEIEISALIGKFDDLQNKADNDLARLVELLLLENHVLTLGQSQGFGRGANVDFENFPRFLALTEPSMEEGDPAQ